MALNFSTLLQMSSTGLFIVPYVRGLLVGGKGRWEDEVGGRPTPRIITRVTWLVLALVVVILSVFGSLNGFVFLPLRLPILTAPLWLLRPLLLLLSGIIGWVTFVAPVNIFLMLFVRSFLRKPSSALHGGIPLERLCGKAPDYSDLRLFGCVSYVLLAPRERTKLTAQSVECVFLGYSAEHKGYHCWDPVGHRMRISRDVVFDESCPFYPHPSSDASLASLPSDEPSSSPSEPFSDEPLPAASSPAQLIHRGHRSRQPVDRYGFGRVTWQCFAGAVLSEPLSYRDAILHPEWQLAMAEEIATLERTGTWDLVPTPSHVRPITCKWVYKVKTRSDGSLERYKARLVARGFQQEHGRDYDETFAPVAHMTTVRALFAMASIREWSISQLDVKNVFLNGVLHKEVYMQPPPGYSVPEGMVCHLRRSLYGFKQAPHAWFQRFASVVTAAGFSASTHDPALFVHTSSRGRTLLLLYARLSEQFLMSDLGPLRYFLGIEGLLDRASMTNHRTEETSMELNLHLSATDGEPLDDPTRYRHIVGSLVYLGVTRPDISYSVHILFVSAPTQLHYSHLLRVLRYLRRTMSRRLFFPRSSSLQLQAYSDATWASDSSDRRSLSAYYVFLGGSLVAWKTKKQTTVSRSSTEVELRAMALVTAEVTWLRWLLAAFGVSVSIPTPLLTDSICAISIARDPVKHELTKHIGVDAYYTRVQVQDGVVTLRYVPSELQLVDFFTKAQIRAQHSFYLSKLSVFDPP
ncbi:hypothetical protein U9M48_019867 [Paspalum notatum var. saurae]|uniref:Reverse transcriptase Ty1/copia-type domain-containing protein n=1 Tax=Paspalum notatum var. saurae TaxID=547442 RepID=A0AAQ3TD23_PASNO